MARTFSSSAFRIWAYEWLARVFTGEFDAMADLPGGANGNDPLAATAIRLRDALVEASRDELAAEHARLFVNAMGGVPAPPYASWYLDGVLAGPAAARVVDMYAAQGVETDPECGEPPDYIGTELEFLYFLARHEMAARTLGDEPAIQSVLGTENEFMLTHVARWLPAFVERIRSADSGPVFRAATELLAALVQEDVTRLSVRRSNSAATRGLE